MAKNIYVGNLTWDATADDLLAFFQEHGQVARAQVITDKETGRSRGFGFVEMNNDAEAQKAIDALNGQPFQGRPLTVNEARPREDRGGVAAAVAATAAAAVAAAGRRRSRRLRRRWRRRLRRRWWWWKPRLLSFRPRKVYDASCFSSGASKTRLYLARASGRHFFSGRSRPRRPVHHEGEAEFVGAVFQGQHADDAAEDGQRRRFGVSWKCR